MSNEILTAADVGSLEVEGDTLVVKGMKVGKKAPKLRKDGTARKERTVVEDAVFVPAYVNAQRAGKSVTQLANVLGMAVGSVIQRIQTINESLMKLGRKPLPKLARQTGERKDRSALAALVEATIGKGTLESLPVDAPISGEAPEMSETEANADA